MYQSADSGGCAVVRGGLQDRRGEYNRRSHQDSREPR